MNFAFRVDASAEIGTGHIMRCLTLAEALQARGGRIRFVSRHLPDYLQQILTAKGHEFMRLNDSADAIDELPHSPWLGTSQFADANATLAALADQSWDWLIVDHYALDERWEKALRHAAKKVMVIDDIADRRHDCELLLDQNYYEDMETRYTGLVPENCRLLLGPRYALLREEFRRMHEKTRPRSGAVGRILVFFGGMDSNNYTATAIDALKGILFPGLQVDVVIGAQHPKRQEIAASCEKLGISCHVQTNKMAELMLAADLSIGAGGAAIWERCCLGLPTLAFSTAENQKKQVYDAASVGLLYSPESKDELVQTMRRHALCLMENGSLRQAISRKTLEAVDGSGSLRVCANLGANGITIRQAEQNDSTHLFEWRNHPQIRAVSRNTATISRDNHQQWFASLQGDRDRILLIGEQQGAPIGVVRFDIAGDEAEVSIYLVPGVKGLGSELLQGAENWIGAHRPDLCKIHACVLGTNDKSRRLFSGSGYQLESSFYSKRLNPQ